MRIPFNKALTPGTNEGKAPSTVGTHPGKAESMNKEIKKVADVAAALEKENPETRAQYLKGVADAQKAQEAAAKAKEEAESEAAFNKACDDESHARDKEAFFRRQLDRLDFTPRMNEADYNKHVDAVKAAVEKAAADFRRTAEKAIDDLVAARAEYLAITKEADESVSPVHDRMPLIMPEELVTEWIRPDRKPEELLPRALTDMDFEKVL